MACAPAAGLVVSPPTTVPPAAGPVPDYDRDRFGDGWSDVDQDCQDTRQEILIRDLVDEQLDRAGTTPSRVALLGRPKYSPFTFELGTSVVVPSIDTTRSPQQNTPAAPSAAGPPVGPATDSNSMCTG
jgi:hypothetical protein